LVSEIDRSTVCSDFWVCSWSTSSELWIRSRAWRCVDCQFCQMENPKTPAGNARLSKAISRSGQKRLGLDGFTRAPAPFEEHGTLLLSVGSKLP